MIPFALKTALLNMGPDARVRVDLKHGYISYSAQDWDKAVAIFETEGMDFLLCKDIYDDGKSIFAAVANA